MDKLDARDCQAKIIIKLTTVTGHGSSEREEDEPP
jgi:hypothetical protein